MLIIRNARIPTAVLDSAEAAASALEPWVERDVAVDASGVIESVAAPGTLALPDSTEFSADRRLLFPGFIDAHTHLDKTHTWDRAPNPRGEFWDAIRVLGADSAKWTAEDLKRRADFGLRSAYAHGTSALRTHLDTSADFGDTAHSVMTELRKSWKGKIELQTVALCSLDSIERDGDRIQALAARHSATALGGFPQPNPNLDRQLDRTLAIARELGIGIDLHVDESGLEHAECLRATAEAVLRTHFPLPVACGHCCSLAVQPDQRARTTIDLVRAAGIHIISLPLCNLYLQDRRNTPVPGTPRWRGVTLLHELIDAGVSVSCASDNVRDAFHAYGDYDVLEVWREAVRIGHLDTRMDRSVAAVTLAPARAMGLKGYGQIAAGATGGLVLSDARTFSELASRPNLPRRRLVSQSFKSLHPPSFSELL